jgi:TonB-linked SusC/RagA family outer membrane protein
MNATRRMGAVLLALAALVGWTAAAAAQATGTIQGTVTDAQAMRPLSGVQVSIPGTRHGTLTNSQGRYQLVNVPAGTHSVRAEFIGYSAGTRGVTVAEGATATANFALETTAVALQELVVTGVAGATTRAKVPFAIEQLRAEDMPVPMVSAGQAIQGKVAGAQVVQGSGRPGASPSILLRGATSLDASGRGQEPLYIVDGVILGGTMVDIDALDIQNIEVVKGAAAASLYGSRAANGVVNITTRRGSRVGTDQVRYSARTEIGRSEIAGTPDALLTQRHHWRTVQTDTGTFFVNSANAPCRFELCNNVQLAGQGRDIDPETGLPIGAANAWNTYQNQSWPGQTYDQVRRFFRDNPFQQHYVSAEGRSGATTFHVSYSNLHDGGVIPGLDGYQRNNFRLNLDQAIRDDLILSASAFYSRGTSDQFPETNGNPIFRLTRMPAGVNLQGCSDDPSESCMSDPARLMLRVHPDFAAEAGNPLYEVLTREHRVDRGRFLGSTNLRVAPLSWFDVDVNASYDRFDYEEEDYYPLGFRTVTPSPGLNRGSLSRWIELTESFNASATGTMRFRLTPHITNRTQLRYLLENQQNQVNWTRGFDFQVEDIPQFQNLDQANVIASSQFETVRADGAFAITNFDIYDRYIIDALVRNDGSSLFGADQRRQWYYRVAGAWRAGEEPWFRVPAIDEFKFRAAVGTAGNRPRFEAQYETFSVAGGRVTPQALGNTDLRPEFSREVEVGLDASLLDGRFILGLTHANVVTSDQILRVPLPGYSGYVSQWQNAGTLENNVFEASIGARLLEARDLTWSARLQYDRTRSTITELSVPNFTYGTTGQNLNNVFYARPGERVGTFYGIQYATSCAHLPAGMSCDGFSVNDDGYLVYAGPAGLADPQWGSMPPGDVTGAAPHLASMLWGTPFAGVCTDPATGEETTFCRLGKTMPDYSIGLSSTVNWRGLSLYGLLDAQRGFQVYNQALQWATFRRTAGLLEQDPDLPLEQQKPVGYYDIVYNASGLRPASPFVEDASFVKLREVTVGYRIGGQRLGSLPGILNNLDGVGITLTGRNLLTWTDYRGFDPEVGRSTTGAGAAGAGSAAISRVDAYQYPNFRTWTLGLDLNF